jgi:hypothetical protein
MQHTEEEVRHIVDLVSGLNTLLPDARTTPPAPIMIGVIAVIRREPRARLGVVELDREVNVFRYNPDTDEPVKVY